MSILRMTGRLAVKFAEIADFLHGQIKTKEMKKDKFVQHSQKISTAGENVEKLSDRLDVIENKLSLHLPLDVSPSDLQS